MSAAALIVAAVGAALPATPISPTLGFAPVPAALYVTLAVMVVAYLISIEVGKRFFFHIQPRSTMVPLLAAGVRHLRRRTHRFSRP